MSCTTNERDRAALIAGLRGLADFLAAHPDVPVPPGYHDTNVNVFPGGDSDTARYAVVDRAAAVLGTPASDPDEYGHYSAVRRFGPVAYCVIAVSSARRAAHTAQTSYYGSVTA